MKGDIANPRLYDSTHDTKSHLNGILATTLPPEQEHPREPSSTYSHRYAQYLFVTGPRNMNERLLAERWDGDLYLLGRCPVVQCPSFEGIDFYAVEGTIALPP